MHSASVLFFTMLAAALPQSSGSTAMDDCRAGAVVDVVLLVDDYIKPGAFIYSHPCPCDYRKAAD